jgi:hypothetical protein
VIYLYLDARYEKVRMDGQIRDAAILIARGGGKDEVEADLTPELVDLILGRHASETRLPSGSKEKSLGSHRKNKPAGQLE